MNYMRDRFLDNFSVREAVDCYRKIIEEDAKFCNCILFSLINFMFSYVILVFYQ